MLATISANTVRGADNSSLNLSPTSGNSPAIDAGDNAVASQFNLTTDQRGVGHSRISRGRVDIGAFELQESFVVTTLHDEDDGTTDPGIGRGMSLREAIALANRASTP